MTVVGAILVMTTMSPQSPFIRVIKMVLDTIRSEIHPKARMATVMLIDDTTLTDQVQVQLLVTGL